MSIIAGAALCLSLGGYWVYIWSLYGDDEYLDRDEMEDSYDD